MAQLPYEDALEAVREGLVAAQDSLRQEIAGYPDPIAGCGV